MDATQEPVSREVRLAVGGPPPADWAELSTPELKLRWASTVAYAKRTLVRPPTPEEASMIISLARELDRRGALLAEVATGSRAERVAAATARLYITGTMAHARGLPTELHDLARADAVATVAALRGDQVTVEELTSGPGSAWKPAELDGFFARASTVHDPATDHGAPDEPHGPLGQPAFDVTDAEAPAVTAPADRARRVVDISVPHHADAPLNQQ